MMTRILKSSYLMLLLAAFAFVACEKEETADLGEVVSEEAFMDMERSGQLGAQGCFQLVFPLTLVFEDGSTAEVDSRQAIREAIRTYVAENGRPSARPEFEFPYEVELPDGSVEAVESSEDIRALLDECGFEPGDGPRPMVDRPIFLRPNICFTLVFPVTVEFPNGSTVEVEDRAGLARLYRRWNNEFPNRPRGPKLQFPVEVELEADGAVVTAEDYQGLLELARGCAEDFEPCFTVNYPVSIALPDGSTQEANSREEVRDIFKAWREANPTSTERPEYVFPIDVTLNENGSTLTLEDKQALRELIRDCRGIFEPCFVLNYPVTIALPDGTTEEANSREEVGEIFRSWRQDNPQAEERPEYVFPLELTLLEDGTTVSVEDKESLRAILEDCRD